SASRCALSAAVPITVIYRQSPSNSFELQGSPRNRVVHSFPTRSSADRREIPRNTVECRGIPRNAVEYRGIPPNAVEYRGMPWDTAEYRRMTWKGQECALKSRTYYGSSRLPANTMVKEERSSHVQAIMVL